MYRAFFAALLVLLGGCQSDEYPVPIRGSTYRISKDEPAKGSEIRIDMFTSWTDCVNAKIDEIDSCLPRADRAAGEMRFAFDLKDPTSGSTIYRSLEQDQVSVSHEGSTQSDFELIPHDPVSAGQLFILLIDGSGSMYDNDGERARKVYDALLTPSVIQGFFPEENAKSGVVLLRFTGPDVLGLDGNPPRVIKSAADYQKMIKQNLLVPTGGYTYLYGAVRYAVTELLALKPIDSFLAIKSAEPTLIVLTDGFNNEAASDTCGDNVDRLNETLETIREARRGVGASARSTVYSVGLGVPYRKTNDSAKDKFNKSVTARGLCGKFADYPIDGGLEDQGIDNVSLEWIAEAGNGISFVKRNPSGLAEVFQKAAGARYRWYEMIYKVPDAFFHRKTFEIKLRLQMLARAETSVKVHPSAWMDAPPGVREGERWTRATPFRKSVAFFMPILGLLVLLTFVGPAWFNARRAIFRRARPRKK